MKPTLGKQKNMRGRVTAHTARIGPILAASNTPAGAVELCERLTLDALARLSLGVEVRRWRGHVAIIAPTTEGWCYWLDTQKSAGICNYVGPDRARAIASALHHLAQNAWTPDVDDREFLRDLPEPEEIARWIGFQRAYLAEKAAGKTDVEAHRDASAEG